jgi:crotonobetainyl-CoA:carnitine CoA-transferase CaiB-like acyl-CoA transferase
MMVEKEKGDLLLTSYRVLDLTDQKGFLAGELLADLGADVVTQ